MNVFVRFLKNWTLPVGMTCGMLGFLAFHYVRLLAPIKSAAQETAEFLMPTVLFIMLFATFCKVNPRDMRITRWHVWLVLFQLLSCLEIALFMHFTPGFSHALLAEWLMICLVCTTAGAAAVITCKLGGSETSLTTYTILSNLAAAIIIPLVFPLVEKAHKMACLLPFGLWTGAVSRVDLPFFGLQLPLTSKELTVLPVLKTISVILLPVAEAAQRNVKWVLRSVIRVWTATAVCCIFAQLK